jgi:hypothetical protein
MSCNRVLTALSLAAILCGATSAAAQQAGAPQPLGAYGAPPAAANPAIGVAPLAPPAPQQFAAPPPDLTPQTALTGAAYEPIKTQTTLCVRPVMVDEEPHTWSELERLDQASIGWNAYMQGDYTRAEPYFERLAKLGHPEAQRLMGVVYYLGQGVPQDYARALYWFEKAANQGCWTAYAPTALMYKNGQGTGVDLGKAYMWLNISVAGLPDSVERDELIKGREQVAGLMTAAQIEAAQKRSLSFKPAQTVPPDPQDLPLDYFPKPQQ